MTVESKQQSGVDFNLQVMDWLFYATILNMNKLWIIPSFNTKTNQLIPHKYEHVSLLGDDFSCNCTQQDYDTMSCVHKSIVEMVYRHDNPTNLMYRVKCLCL